MSLREAMIIMPTQDNRGSDLSTQLASLQAELTDIFGGCTVTNAMGSWKSDGAVQTEPVACFAVASRQDQTSDDALLRIADRYGAACGQESVYVRLFGGSVAFVTPEQKQQAA